MTNANLPTPSTKELRLFLDTADVDQWKAWMPTGMFYGITSNPLLLERASVPCSIQGLTHLAHQAFALGAEEMQMQTWGNTVDDLVNTGRAIADIDQRVVVKVPITKTGTEAASQLITNGVRVT
ncbi:MAG: transaldolase family protein [Cyanobacteria bacterium P01_E01_bin.6]